MDKAISTSDAGAPGAPKGDGRPESARILLTLPEFLVQSAAWVTQVPVLDQLLIDVCDALGAEFLKDGFEIGERGNPSLLRGTSAFGQRAALRVSHPLFGWCEVQTRLTVHWPVGAELTLVAFPEIPGTVRPRKLRNDCIAKRELAHIPQVWGEATAGEGLVVLHDWLATLSGTDIGAISLFAQAEPFLSDVEQALAP
jgi:hypothetical protein